MPQVWLLEYAVKKDGDGYYFGNPYERMEYAMREPGMIKIWPVQATAEDYADDFVWWGTP